MKKSQTGKNTQPMHIMYYAAEQMMKCSMPFVLENNFEDASRPEIMELLNQYRYQGITVLLTGDPAVIYERFKNRMRPLTAIRTCM